MSIVTDPTIPSGEAPTWREGDIFLCSLHFHAALERASFDQMRKDQEGTTVERVRKGIVGGYKDELSPEDIAFIQERIHE